MRDDRKFGYAQRAAGSSGFSRVLMQRVDAYFAERGTSRHANPAMIAKTVLAFVLWIGTYALLIRATQSAPAVVAAYVVHGLAQLFMAFNIGHDANHGAYAQSKLVNRVLGHAFDLVGVSAYFWRLMHNDSHHAFINVRGADTTLISGKVFRFSPYDSEAPHHRFQHLYAVPIYCLSTLDWVLTKDYRWLFATDKFGNRIVRKHPRDELAVLILGKFFYYGYTLVVPFVVLPVSWVVVLAGFVVMHLLIGFAIALIFQPNHFNAAATFPEADERGQIDNSYIRHVFDTTLDYAREKPVVTWFLGCLNLHIVHHMFPRICQVHYPALTRIVMQTAREHGLPYREERTVFGAFFRHLQWLKQMGRGDCSQAEPPRSAPATAASSTSS